MESCFELFEAACNLVLPSGLVFEIFPLNYLFAVCAAVVLLGSSCAFRICLSRGMVGNEGRVYGLLSATCSSS